MIKTTYNFFHRHYHRRYHGQYQHAKKLFAIDIGLLAAAILIFASALFFFFWKPGIQEWIDLKVNFGNDRIKSGQPVTITVNYANRSKYDINNISLAIHLPTGFVINRDLTPTADFDDNSIVGLSALPAGGKGQKQLQGTIWITPHEPQEIYAIMTYERSGSKTREQKLGSFILNLPASVIETKLNLSSNSSFPGVTLPFTYTIKNSGPATTNLNLQANFNNGPVAFDNTDLVLGPGESRALDGTITAPAKPGDFNLQVLSAVSLNGQTITQTDDSQALQILEPKLNSSVVWQQPISYVEPGQTLPITVTWKNSSGFNLQNLKLKLNFTPGTVDLKATAAESGFKIDGNALVATAANRTALTNGSGGAQETFDLNVKLLPHFSLARQENPKFEITPEMSATLDSLPNQQYNSVGVGLSIPMATELTLNAQTRYYTDEGDQLGRGPLPPQIGETTKYWIFIEANNTVHPVKNASFSAILVPGVQFTDKQSVSIGRTLNYNEKTNAITWANDSLPAFSKTGLYFEVAISPTPGQANQNIPLLTNIKFNAEDSVTGKSFNLSSPNLNNQLPDSDRGSHNF